MRRKIGALIVAAFAILVVLFLVVGIQFAFDNNGFLAFLLIVFQVIVPFAVAYFASSRFLRDRLPQLLILGCAMFAYGFFSLVVTLGVLSVNAPDAANFIVTVESSGLLVFSVITFLGSMITLSRGPNYSVGFHMGKLSVLASYSVVALLAVLIGLVTLFGVASPFLIAGEYTSLGQGILTATIVLLGTSSVLLIMTFLESRLDMVYWYALGLAATATGALAILGEPVLGTPLSWAGRAAQYVGCGFLLVAVGWKSAPIMGVTGSTEAFKRDKQQLNMLFANMKSGFAYCKMVLDAQGKPADYVFLEVNDAFYEVTGLGEGVLGKKATEVFPGIDKEPADWIGNYGKVAATGEPASFENYESFTNKWYSVSAYTPEKGYFAVVFEDITKRKKAEEELKASEERYKYILQHAPTAIYEIDYNGPRFKSVNDVMCTLTGYSREELLAKSPLDLLDLESQEKFKERIRKALTGEKIDENVEYKAIVKDGSTRWITLKVNLTGKDGKYDGALVVANDVTERKQILDKLEEYARNLEGLVEERTRNLRTSSLYARNLIEASLDPLVTINVDGKITDVNRATEQATGCSREQLIGSDFSDYFTEPEKARTGYMQVFTEGFVKDYALAIRHTSGKITDVMYNAVVYKNEAGEVQGVFAAARDVTELKKAESQAQESAKKLKDSERLAAIGATAGMVGHDIRNPLQAIIGDLFLARNDLASLPESAEKESLTESVDSIQTSVDYVNKIVQDLQDYARPIRPVVHDTDMDSLLKDVLKKNDIPKNVKVTRRITEQAKTLQVDPDLLERILGNLVNNAVQAMPEGGRLTIKSTKKEGDAIFTVKDTGAGIPEEAKPNLFTPLFTTKSKGQGFGLAVVKRMTEALGGTVTFESEAGKGAEFILRIPQEQNKT